MSDKNKKFHSLDSTPIIRELGSCLGKVWAMITDDVREELKEGYYVSTRDAKTNEIVYIKLGVKKE